MKYGSYVTPYYGNGSNGSYAHFAGGKGGGGFAPATAGQAGKGGTRYLAGATSTKLVMVGGAGGYGGNGHSGGDKFEAEAAAGGDGGNVGANVSNGGFPTGGAAFYEAAIAIGGAGGAGGAGGTPGPNGPPYLRGAGAGGAGGTAAAASTAVSGASVVGSTASATGGVGGASYYAGAGGGASSAAASTSTTTSGGGVTASATSTGGAGGYSRYGYGGAGGAATGASATATQTYANTAGTASAVASQTGGVGGASFGKYGYATYGNRGGAGGTASNTSASATGYNASATVTQTGGAGGYGRGGYGRYGGGAGADSTLTDAVSGTTTGGTLTLSQTAAGGAGGASYFGQGGQGGYAASDLNFSDTTSTVFNGFARAYGGAGGSSNDGNGGAGGAAEASDTITGANTVTAYAGAYGGNGGASVYGYGGYGGAASATSTAVATGAGANSTATANATASSGAGSTQGAANATAAATTAAGQLASAYGAATGSSGLAQSTATTAASSGPVVSLSSEAQAPVAGSGALANSQAVAGTTVGFPHAPPALGAHPGDAYAFGAIAPNNVATEFSTDPTVAAAFGGEAQAVFGEGVEGANYGSVASGDVTYVSTQNFTLSGADTSGNLIVGPLDSRARGTGFTNLDFQVTVGGVTEEDVSFTSLAAAEAFFSDNVLNLGAMPTTPGTVVSVKLSVTEDAAGQGFGQDFFIGDSNAATINGPPTINVPAAEAIGVGTETIGGISVAETGATTVETFSATISDAIGALSATGFTGDVSNSISISGVSLATLNADLATLADSRGTLASDTITVDVTDSLGNAATQQTIGVTSVFVASPIGGQTFAGRGAGITLELSSASTLLTIDADAGTVTGLRPSATSGGTDTFSDVQTFVGNPGTGGTTFIAGPGADTYDGAGTGTNTLSYAFSSAGSLAINTVAGTAQADAVESTFSGVQTFVGLAGGDTDFITGSSGGFAFTGQGAGNTLDLSEAPAGVSISESYGTGSASVAGGGTNTFSGIQSFVGSAGGDSDFIVGFFGGGLTFTGQGAGNTLDLSEASGGLQVFLTPNGQGQEVVDSGWWTSADAFTDIATIKGSAYGNSTFYAGPGNYTLQGAGAGNTLSYASAPNPVTFDTGAGTATGGYAGTVNFTDIQTFVGSSSGGNTFIAGSAGGMTFTGEGAGNTLELGSSTGLLTINATSLPVGALASLTVGGLDAGATDSFSDIQTFVGNTGTGGTTFLAGPTASAYQGAGTGTNTLSYAFSSAGSLAINTVAGTAQADSVESTFSGIQSFDGLASGNTTFITGSSGGLAFTGTGSGNVFELGGSTALLTVDAAAGQVTGLQAGYGGATTDTFSGIGTFEGNTGAGGTTFIAGPTAGAFTGEGTGTNTLSLANVPTSMLTPLTIDATTGEPTSGTAQAGSVEDTFSDIQHFVGSGSGNTTFISNGANGLSFTGEDLNNTLDLSAAPAGLQIDAAGGTVVDGANAESFSGIQTFVGSSSGGNTFIAGSAGGMTFTGEGAGNTLELGSSTGLLTINATSLPVGALASLTVGGLDAGATDSFSDIQTFVGNTGTGGTTFLAGPTASAYQGAGTGTNTLSYAFSSAGSLAINTVAGTAQADSVESTFSGIQSFDGLASGNTTFITGSSGGLAFTGTGSGNVFELGGSTALLTVDAAAGQVTGLQAGYGGATTDTFSGIGTFEGNTGAGGTTFIAGPTAGAFTGEGTGTNTLSLANVPTSMLTPLTIDATTGEPTSGTAQAGSVEDTFSDIQHFVGSGSGNTTFISNGANGLSFTGEDLNNTLDLSAAPAGLQIDAATGTVVDGANAEAFSDIQTFVGSSSGGNTFIAGSAGGMTFTGEGAGNTLELGSSTGLLTINATSLPVGALASLTVGGLDAGATDSFSDIQTFVGNTGTGGTTFLAGPTASAYQGAGTGTNTLSYAFSSAGSLAINTVAGTAQADSVESTFSGIQSFDGLASGNTTFITGSSGGLAFTGTGSGNVFELGGSTALLTVDAAAGQVTGLQAGYGGATTDTFSGIGTFEGNTGAGGTTFIAGPTAGAFEGEGDGPNTLSFANVPTSPSTMVTIDAATGTENNGATTDHFSDIQDFVGSGDGNTDFVSTGADVLTFTGLGSNNTLDLSGAPEGVAVTESSGVGSASFAGGGTDSFSGIQTFKGSSAGGTIFTVGAGNATFEGGGGGNELTFAADAAGITFNLGAGTVTTANGSDDFSDIQTLIGSSSGQNDFIGGSGSHTLEAQGSGNTLDYSSASAAVTIDTVTGMAQNGFGGNDSFEGIQDFVGSSVGGNTFISDGAGGLAFTGEGAGNTLDLSAVTGLLTLNLAAGTATTSSGVEHFSGIQTLTVSAAGGVDLAGIGQATSFSYNAGSQTLTILGGNQTVQLGVAPPPAGDDFSLASDGSGTLLTLTSVAAPSISAPASATITPGHATTIAGVSVAGGDSQDAAETFRATISDTNGDLTATGFSGSATGISINGVSLATLNADLATLSDTDGTAGPDTINYSVTDSFGHTVTRSTAISLGALAGFYLPPGATTPIEDLAGTYSGPGATAPTTDPAGTFSGPGAPAPTTDPAGTFSGLGAAAPTPAAAGTYIPTTGATSAAAEIKDPAGTYSAAGAAAPTQDPAGTFSGVGAATPTTDPAGTYSGKGASAPTTDPAGTFSGPDASAPTPDPSGTYSDPGASAPTAIDAWKNASGGAWTTSGNWKNSVPNATEYAGVQATGTYAVTIGSASAAYGLIINDAGASVNDGPGESLTLDGSNGASNPNGVLYVTAGKFNLEGGALKAASISIGTGGAFLVSGSIFATLAEAITDLGILSIANSAAVTLTGSLSGSGAVLVQNSALVTFDGPITGSEAFTIANSALVTFAGAITGSETFTISNSADVRIASSITGTGSFNLANSAQLEFEAADSEAVNFLAGSTGTLKIDKSLTAPMTGAISGLTTSNRVDLADLGYVSGKMKATYAGTAAGGTLTISNGTKSVALTLAGNYLHSTWTLSKDASGGTLVVDPPASSPALFGQLAASMPTPSCEAYALPAHDLAIGGAGPVLAHPVA